MKINLSPLKSFVDKSRTSRNALVKQAADNLSAQMLDAQKAEEVSQPTLHKQEAGGGLNNIPKDEIDKTMSQMMPDIKETEKMDSSRFGKVASAYACDIEVGKLPKATREDVKRFTPTATDKTKVVQYGMVESELISKVDSHNFKLAKEHVAENISKKGKRAVADEFQDKVKDKYILLLNDSIVDGHHFLAMAKALGISCSLKVLDLTPVRFQKTAHSLFYALHNDRRKTAS